jgi:hypothetical protein
VPDLRAVVVMDYQNVHLTAHELFAVSRGLPRHESLVDPVHFGIQLIVALRARRCWPAAARCRREEGRREQGREGH